MFVLAVCSWHLTLPAASGAAHMNKKSGSSWIRQGQKRIVSLSGYGSSRRQSCAHRCICQGVEKAHSQSSQRLPKTVHSEELQSTFNNRNKGYFWQQLAFLHLIQGASAAAPSRNQDLKALRLPRAKGAPAGFSPSLPAWHVVLFGVGLQKNTPLGRLKKQALLSADALQVTGQEVRTEESEITDSGVR